MAGLVEFQEFFGREPALHRIRHEPFVDGLRSRLRTGWMAYISSSFALCLTSMTAKPAEELGKGRTSRTSRHVIIEGAKAFFEAQGHENDLNGRLLTGEKRHAGLCRADGRETLPCLDAPLEIVDLFKSLT